MRLKDKPSMFFRGDFFLCLHVCFCVCMRNVCRHMHAIACVRVRGQIGRQSSPSFLFEARFLFVCSVSVSMQGLFVVSCCAAFSRLAGYELLRLHLSLPHILSQKLWNYST